MADPLTHYADHVTRVTLSGKMFSGNEIWQTGFFIGRASGPVAPPTQAIADMIRDNFVLFWKDAANGINTYTSLEEIKLAELDVNGKYVGEPVVSHPATATAGGSPGVPLPPQVALVVTLVAGSGKGLAGKGRMYLPGVNQQVDATGHIAGSYAQTLANNLRLLFSNINSQIPDPDGVVNASRGHKASLGIGARNVPVNGIRVGTVYDTQRRRRNGLQEVYATSALVTP